MERLPETCERCGGWVFHRTVPCTCKTPTMADLLNQREALKEACLNAIGFIGGKTVLTKELVLKRLSEAVKPLLK